MHRPSIRRRAAHTAPATHAAPDAPRVRRSAAIPIAGATVGLAALAGAALVAVLDDGRVPRIDRQVHRLTGLSRRGGLRELLDPRDGAGGHPWGVAAAAVGGKRTTLVASVIAAALAARRHGPAHAAPFLAAYGASFGLHGLMKPALKRKRPRVARLMGKRTPSFPSGHAARVAAVAALGGYAAVVEGLAPPRVVIPLGVAASLASGGGRLANERHWGTDIVGGWGLGVAVAGLCALWYDRLR